MRIFLLLSLLFILPLNLTLLANIAPIAGTLQKNCAALIPSTLTNQKLAQSFTCGTPLNDPDAKEVFQKTSLLHLMVVSGSHLQLLSFFIFLPLPSRYREKPIFVFMNWMVLFAYCFVTGFQPPVVRAFAARLFFSVAHRFRWHWDGGKVQVITGLVLLLIFPNWILSLSFYLSWLASLGFLLTPLYQKSEQTKFSKALQSLLNCALIQSFVGVGFCQYSFLGIIMNALFAPLIALSLFPLSLLSVLIPDSIPIVDAGWNFLLTFLNWMSEHTPESNTAFQFNLSSARWIFLWSFLAFVHCFFEALRQQRYRKSNV